MSIEVPRNIFIAVGSSAIIGMTHLLERLKGDGIYDQKREDIFIGMDSDISRLQALKSIDMDSNPIRIHTVQLSLSRSSPEIGVVSRLEPDWKNMGEITASGVGGDRRLSFTALNWKVFWDDVGIDTLLAKGDRVILLGSAFGGTSTGIFWNIAEYIQMRIRSKIELLGGHIGDIQFWGMLLLPEKNSQSSAEYPLYRNLCAFLQDMQLIEWRQVLEQKLAVGRSFLSPIYSAWDKRSDTLPVFISEKYKCAEASNLPMEMLFMLPTPENSQGQTKLYFTELAFTLFYLNLSSKIVSTTIDSFKQKLDQEELCFGGFNMVVARSASNAVLKTRYYELLSQHWHTFWKSDLPDTDDMVDDVCAIINQALKKNDDASNLDTAVQKKHNEIASSNISVLSKEFPEHLQEFAKTNCDTIPYFWQSPENLIKEVYSNSIAKDSAATMPLAAIAKAYKREYDSMTARAENADNILENIAAQLRKAVKLQRERANSKVARLVNGVEGSRAEITAKIREYLKTAVEEFIDAHRAAATLKSMPDPMDIETLRTLPQYAKSVVQIENRINASKTLQKSKLKGFVFEDINNNLHLDVGIPGLNFTKICLEFLLAEDESTLTNAIKKYENLGIDILRSQANDLKENNPLKDLHTRIPTNELNSYCADVFRVGNAGKGHLHFCYTCGHPSNIDWPTWSELKNELGFASFGRFPGAGADNAKAVLDSTLQGPGENSWFSGNNVSGLFKNMQGVWLGTLNLNKTIAEILQSTFRGAPIDDWENNAGEAEEIHGAPRLRLMTLRDMVYMGIVLGAIEKKIIDVVHLDDSSFNSVKINLKIKSKSGVTIIERNHASPSALGFNLKLKMHKISLDWIENLMKWFSDRDTGFIQDLELSNRDSIDGHLLFEKHCLNKIKMQVPPDYLKEIEALFDKVYDFIEVARV